MKRISKIAAAAAIVAAAGFTAYNAQNKELQMSPLEIENVEAIARGESNGTEYHLIPCPAVSGVECRISQYNYPTCGYPSYCN